MKENNMNLFREELSNLVGKPIGKDHIHEGTGRYYYIQPAKKGYPMLLNHYRGPFFVDIHPDDLKGLESGELDAHEFIHTANWQIGYYWGGGSMVGGGYYQPFDIVGHSDEVKRYFSILSCRGNRLSSGYIPTEDRCNACTVENCPFSNYMNGNWEDELKEYDPRRDFFEALVNRFEKEYPGYTLRGFLSAFECGSIPNDQIWIRSNGHYNDDEPYSFTAYASAETIRGLLMREIEPENWDKYAEGFIFAHTELFDEKHDVVTMDRIKEIFSKFEHTNDTEIVEEEVHKEEAVHTGLINRLMNCFRK